MTAIAKSERLLRIDLPLALLVKNARNPNKMKPREFDLLVDNMEQTGWTDPLLCRPIDLTGLLPLVAKHEGDPAALAQAMVEANLQCRIVGGHHRYDAGSYLGFEQAPCTVILDPGFDEEAEQFQLVRMNVIRGRLDPQAFFDLYQQVSDKYADDVLQEAFGFADEREFSRLVEQTTKQIPDPAMARRFREAAKEVKTVDGLAKLLNQLFTKYGDTLPYGFMVFDHGGQRSIWLQVDGKTLKAFDRIGELCIERRRTADDLVGGLVQMIAKGELDAALERLVQATPEVVIPSTFGGVPTKEALASQPAA